MLVKLLPNYPWIQDTYTLSILLARQELDDYWRVRLNKSKATIKDDEITVRLWTD
jgi:hypothetical protein